MTTDADTSVFEFIPRRIRGRIFSVKLVWTNKDRARRPNEWEALAIKFRPDVKKDELIDLVVGLKADEYWGKVDGHYVMWFD